MDEPAWHDRPTGPGLWYCIGDKYKGTVVLLSQYDLERGAPFYSTKVYGPIPKPPGKEETCE